MGLRRRISRRTFLKVAGGGGIAVAGAIAIRAHGVGLLPTDNGPFRLWTEATSGDGHHDLIAAAVLAANPHNSQPWAFHVDGDRIDVRLDRARALGPVDPVLRQMHIGIGCAVENLSAAARARGLLASVSSFPDPADPDLAARVVLSGGSAIDSRQADAIRHRHTNRGPYDRGRRLPDADRDALAADGVGDGPMLELFDAASERGEAFARSIVAATATLIADEAFMNATDRWFRWTPREIADSPDGPSLRCAGLSPAVEMLAAIGPRQGKAKFHAAWLASTRDVHFATAPTFGLVAVRDPSDPAQRLEAGRRWQRFHLEATRRGLSAQPLDQAIEAFERMRQRGLESSPPPAPAGMQAAMMFRVGYAIRPAVPSARRPLNEVLI